MARLSKEQAEAHAKACELVDADRPLTVTEREFVLDNWHEAGTATHGLDGAFFTPEDLASDAMLAVPTKGRIIDLCAGIGRLAYHVLQRGEFERRYNAELMPEIVCVERNPEYARVGKAILPEARWVCADVLDVPAMLDELGGRFDYAISNPPFGRIKRGGNGPGYTGPLFEFHTIAVASRIARHGVFIIPRMSSPFTASPAPGCGIEQHSAVYERFRKQTGIELGMAIGIDTDYYKDGWRGVSVSVEVAEADFTELPHHNTADEPVATAQPAPIEDTAPGVAAPAAVAEVAVVEPVVVEDDEALLQAQAERLGWSKDHLAVMDAAASDQLFTDTDGTFRRTPVWSRPGRKVSAPRVQALIHAGLLHVATEPASMGEGRRQVLLTADGERAVRAWNTHRPACTGTGPAPLYRGEESPAPAAPHVVEAAPAAEVVVVEPEEQLATEVEITAQFEADADARQYAADFEALAFERDRGADVADLRRAMTSYYSRAESPYFSIWWKVQEQLDEIARFRASIKSALNREDGRERVTSADGRLTYALPATGEDQDPTGKQAKRAAKLRAAVEKKNTSKPSTRKYPKKWRGWVIPAPKPLDSKRIAELDTGLRITLIKDDDGQAVERRVSLLPDWERVVAETEAAPGVWLPMAAVQLAEDAMAHGFTVAMERHPDGRTVVRAAGGYSDSEGRGRRGELAAVWGADSVFDPAASFVVLASGRRMDSKPALDQMFATVSMERDVTAGEMLAPAIDQPAPLTVGELALAA